MAEVQIGCGQIGSFRDGPLSLDWESRGLPADMIGWVVTQFIADHPGTAIQIFKRKNLI